MTINGIDLSTFSATLLSKQLTNHDVIQVYDWLDGASGPVFSRSEQQFKDISLTILIETSSESETESQFSALIRAIQACTVEFDDLPKRFDCHFKGKVEPKYLTARAWLVEVDLLCHKTYLPEVILTANEVSSKIVTSLGSQSSPCLITVTPTTDIAEFVILGFSSEIWIQNLEANKVHTIDGYLYRYLKDGANDIANYYAFTWPVLPIGTTNLIFSHSTTSITIQYHPILN